MITISKITLSNIFAFCFHSSSFIISVEWEQIYKYRSICDYGSRNANQKTYLLEIQNVHTIHSFIVPCVQKLHWLNFWHTFPCTVVDVVRSALVIKRNRPIRKVFSSYKLHPKMYLDRGSKMASQTYTHSLHETF